MQAHQPRLSGPHQQRQQQRQQRQQRTHCRVVRQQQQQHYGAAVQGGQGHNCGAATPQDPPSAYHTLRQQQHHQQQQHDPPQKPRCWPRPVDDVCKAISKRLKQADSFGAVLQVVQHHAAQFNTVNTSLAYAQLARHLRFETSSSRTAALQHSSYGVLQGLALHQAGTLNPRQVVMVLTSLAWMAECSSPADATTTGLDAAGDAAAAGDGAAATAAHPLEQQQQQAVANELPQQQQQQHLLLLQRLSQQLHLLLDDCEPEDTCHCLWALTRLAAPNTGQLLAAATAHGLSRGWIGTLTAKPLSSLLWVHAQAHLLRQQQQQDAAEVRGEGGDVDTRDLVSRLVCAVMHEVSQPGFLATWTPQELSMLLWSCAVLGVPLEQQQQPPQQQQQQHAASAVLPLSVLQEVCQLAQQYVVQFTPQGVAMVCWSLARLLTSAAAAAADSASATQQQQQPSQHSWQQHVQGAAALQPLAPQLQQAVLRLFDSFTAAAAARLRYYKPQEVANIYSACSRLQLMPAALQHGAGSYVCSHTHLLGCRDVTDLLLAAAQQQHQWRQPGLDAAAVRALLHRAGHLLPEFSGFQLAAAAWACTKLGQQQRQQHGSSPGSSSRSNSSSRGVLQDECLAVASQLLDSLGSHLMQSPSSASVDAVAAAGAQVEAWAQLLVPNSSSQLPAEQQHRLDVKQAVALAWALAATLAGSTSSAPEGGPNQQQQHKQLMGAVLAQLQQGVGMCDASALVQLLCVLVRLSTALPSISGISAGNYPQQDQEQQSTGTLTQQMQQLCECAVSRLQPSLAQLSAPQAVTAAWAAVKLHGGSSSSTPVAVAVLSAVLQQLCERQQLSSLPGPSVSALLWCCRVSGWAPPAAVSLQLLAAADARLLQMPVYQQVQLLQSIGSGAAATAPVDAGMTPQLLQRLRLQQTRLVQAIAEQLQIQLHQQAQQLAWQQRSPANKHSSAVQQQQQQGGLQPHELIAVVAACRALQQVPWGAQPQVTQLLQQVSEVWQLLVQQQGGVVQTCHALLMVWHLADVSPDSPAQPWHTAVLHQLLEQGQQQQHQQKAQPPQQRHALSGVLPQLLQHALGALHAELTIEQQQGQLVAPSTLVLALRVFAKLRYQPPPQVLSVLLQQLGAGLPALPESDLVGAVVSAAQLGLPAPSADLTAAAVAELARRQRRGQQQQSLADLAPQDDDQQQPAVLSGSCNRSGWQSRSRALSLNLLWAVLASGVQRVAAAGDAGTLAASPALRSNRASSAYRLLVKLAREAADVPLPQLLQQPQLLLASQQLWRMLSELPQYKPLQQSIVKSRSRPGQPLPKEHLLQQLRRMTWLLLPQSVVGRERRQALLQMLHASPSQLRVLLQQRLQLWRHQQQQQGQGQEVEEALVGQQQLLEAVPALLPLWLQYQLQKQCCQQLAREVVMAQVAVGGAAARVNFRLTPSGEVVLLLRPQHIAEQDVSSSNTTTSKGLAVVLAGPSSVSVNTGSLLGTALTRDALLRAEGWAVHALPLQAWLPDFLAEHQHRLEMQQAEAHPRRQQYLKQQMGKRMRRLRRERASEVQQVVQLLAAAASC